jgi:lipoprotein-anchoring transpeptidase ErfK/SrfK
MSFRSSWIAPLLALTVACGADESPEAEAGAAEPAAAVAPGGEGSGEASAGRPATALASGSEVLSPEEIERGRMDSTWKQYVDMDPTAAPTDTSRSDTTRSDTTEGRDGSATASAASDTTRAGWDEIRKETVNDSVAALPIHGDVEGPAVARVQILLDLNRFSPGVIDGRWGKNTEKAVYWFQKARGLNATGQVDRATLDALEGGATGEVVTTRTLTAADVAGTFQPLPEDVYARAEQPCLCYESLSEQLAEVFHTTPDLLEQLNPGADLDALAEGDALDVPAVEPFHLDGLPDGKYTGGGDVARIVVSGGGHYVHALDQAGQILYHFPTTLGSDYAPSPSGDFSVESITFDPTWHYQPDLLTGVDPSKEEAVLPEGPNNAVGVVWMQLSKPHYGIHGTSAPETIGYATSHGCVRLTNWDAGFLGQRIPAGVPVEFRDVSGR